MPEAKVRTLTVRPFQSADLAFNEAGILDIQNSPLAKLGVRVSAFDLESLYSKLSDTIAGNDAQLEFSARRIEAFLKNTFLFALRRESLRAALDEAILERENAVLERFSHKAKIIAELRKLYPNMNPVGTPGAKLNHLEQISTASTKRHQDLVIALTADGRLGVVKGPETSVDGTSSGTTTGLSESTSSTQSTTDLTGKITSQSKSVADTTADSTGSSITNGVTSANLIAIKTRAAIVPDPGFENTHGTVVRHNIKVAGGHVEDPPDLRVAARHAETDTVNVPMVFDGAAWTEVTSAQLDTHTQRLSATSTDVSKSHSDSTTDGTSDSVSRAISAETGSAVAKSGMNSDGTFSQESKTVEPLYSHPSSEAEIQHHRGQATLQDEVLTHSVFGFRAPHLERLFDNQLQMVDLRIRQLQVAFSQRFLISPISGVVTGLFKDLGEHVGAGEAVLRVENDEDVLVVGRVQFKSMIRVGANVKLTASNVFEAATAQPVTLLGKVAAIRGHEADNDEWDVILFCDNRGPGNTTKLPINYNFDKDDVKLEIL